MNTAKRKANYHVAFFVSNVKLTDYAINELENYTGDKNKICVCLIKDFISKVHEYENILVNNKIKIEQEKNKCLEYEIENKILKKYNKKLENTVKELGKKLDDIQNQNNLILEILNKK